MTIADIDKQFMDKFTEEDNYQTGVVRMGGFVDPEEVLQFIHQIYDQAKQEAREEEREAILAPARELYDKESRERLNTRKATVVTDKQGNIYILALQERVMGRIVTQDQLSKEKV